MMAESRARNDSELSNDEFILYDLRVIVESVGPDCTCNMQVGECFDLKSGKLSLPDGQSFCVYAMQSVLPLLPAKQRPLQNMDWMNTDVHATCPDPACKLIMSVDRTSKRVVRHSETSAVQPEKNLGSA